jgi:hypothetical protein
MSTERVTTVIQIVAPVDRTWDVMLRHVDRWWPDEMKVLGPTATVSLEPQLAGRLYEYRPDGSGVLVATVIELIPEQSLALQTTASRGTPTAVAVVLEPTALAGTALSLTVSGAEVAAWWARLLEVGLKLAVEAPPSA